MSCIRRPRNRRPSRTPTRASSRRAIAPRNISTSSTTRCRRARRSAAASAEARRAMKKIIGFAMLLLVAPLADAAFAQAWVPGEGEGTVSVLYQGANSLYHYKPTAKVDLGRIDSHALVLDTTYGLTDKIAVDVALPFVVSKYAGTQPHPTSLDDGNYHGTIQDVRLDLRYNMTRRRRMAVTPFVGTVMPSHDYEYYAHSAPGRRLRELRSEEHTSELQSQFHLVCRLLLEKKKQPYVNARAESRHRPRLSAWDHQCNSRGTDHHGRACQACPGGARGVSSCSSGKSGAAPVP